MCLLLLPDHATPQMTQQEHKPLKLEADEDGQLPPLFAAAWGGDITATEQALDAGAAVNAHDADAAWTALTFAAFQGHTAVAKLLLARGADVDSKTTDDATPLMLAVRCYSTFDCFRSVHRSSSIMGFRKIENFLRR